MFKDILDLIKQSIAYGAGNVLITGVGIILIPVYTRFLTVSDYGIIGTLGAFSAVLMYFYNLGMSGAVMRYDVGLPTDEERRIAHGTAWVFLFIVALAMTAIIALVGTFTWKFVFPVIPFLPFAPLLLGTVILDATNVVPLALLRIRGKAVAFSVIQFLRFLSLTSLIILCVVFLRHGALGQLTAAFLTALIFSIVYLAITFRQVKIGLNGYYLKKYLAFGLPLVPGGLFLWALSMSNHLILQRMTSLEQVGLYALGFRFANVLEIAVIAVVTAWQPFFYNKADTDRGPELFALAGTYFLFVVLGVGVAVVLVAQPFLHIATTPKFFDAGRVVGLLVVGIIFRALYTFNVNGIMFRMKTQYISFLNGAAAIVSIGLSFLLIPNYGIMGAAFATIIAYFFLCVSTFVISQRLYQIPHQYGRHIKIVFIYGLAFFSLSRLEFYSDLWTLVIRMVFLPVIILVGLIFLRVPEERETRKVLNFLRRNRTLHSITTKNEIR